MRNRLLFSLTFILTFTIQLISQQATKEISWFDPREAPFELSGFEWIKEERVYRRLPVHPDAPILIMSKIRYADAFQPVIEGILTKKQNQEHLQDSLVLEN
jgi:hypothetical protein